MSIHVLVYINLYLCLFVFMLFRSFCNASWNTEENEIMKDLVFS